MNNISIVDVAVAYDCPYSLTTFILIFHQVFYIPGMHHHLLNPDQMQENGIIVNDIPLIRIPEKLYLRPGNEHPYPHEIPQTD